MLKLLDLTGCCNLCIDDGVFQSLAKLEELYMRVSEPKSIRFSDANCDELKLNSRKLNALEIEFFENFLQPKNVSFKNLQRFRIFVGCFLNDNRYVFSSEEHYFMNTLKLVTNFDNLIECKINELFSKTEELHLNVKEMSNVDDISMFPAQHSTFLNLKVLHVFECEELTHLITISMANGLKKLERLTISSCPLLKSIVVIPNLSKLVVNGLKKLKKIWACDFTSGEEDSVSMLKDIEVNDCNSLVNLFPSNPMRLLTHLEELKVRRCCSIEVIFNIDLGKIEQHISKLRSIEMDELKKLREVWRINEENNSHHLISGFQAVETIDINRCKKFRNVFTPITANFDMSAFINIHIQVVEVKDIEIMDEDMSLVGFPSYHLTRAFNHIRKIYFNRIKGAEVLFEIQTLGINRELVCAHQQQSLPLLPCLEELRLESMDTFLSSLKTLDIRFCEGIEEVVSNRDDDHVDDEVLNTSTTTFFPCLDYLCLNNLSNLKQIGEGVAKRSHVGLVPWSVCQYSTKIEIWWCPSLSSLIPSMVETFQSYIDQGSTSLPIPKTITILPYEPTNLKILKISECDILEYIFTFSILESLKKLEELSICDCRALKVIVREENEKESSKVVFPRLKSIVLKNLPKLVGFFMGIDIDFEWKSLNISMPPNDVVHVCFVMSLLILSLQVSPQSSDGSIVFSTTEGTPWSFHNLIEMNLDFNYKSKNVVPTNELQQLHILEKIHARDCWNLEEVFEVTNTESPTVVVFQKLREMKLDGLARLKYIWMSNEWSILKFPNLTRIYIDD
ncbi:hypothetical protein R6Q57_011138 [Mikania cordata]